jgi:proteasome lid subunit RPN8/RPN11
VIWAVGQITDDAVAEKAIAAIIEREAPKEAVGILWRRPGDPEIVVALSNISDQPTISYAVRTADIVSAIQLIDDDIDVTTIDPADLVLWHSHPSGFVGPSLQDMREKQDGLTYMVVTWQNGKLDAVQF